MKESIANKIINYEHIIIYGDGEIARRTIKYIRGITTNKKIFVALSKSVERSYLLGIEKKNIYDLKKYRNNSLLILAAKENHYGSMTYIAKLIGFSEIIRVEKKDYNLIYKKTENFLSLWRYYLREKPIELYIWLLKKLPIRNTIIFRPHTLDLKGSCELIYRYMLNKNHLLKFKVIWIVKDKDKFSNFHKTKFINIGEIEKFKNLYYLVTSKFLIWEDGHLKKYSQDQISIHITHGMPTIKNVHGIISIPESTDKVLISSNNVAALQSYQMSLEKSKFVVLGLPRLDDLLSKSSNELSKLGIKEGKTIIWMPTFRKLKNSSRRDGNIKGNLGIPLIKTIDSLEILNKTLKTNNIFLLIKLHPLEDISLLQKTSMSHIKIITGEDLDAKKINLYKLIGETDALISDYSSVSFDYLLLNKPIAYIVDDMNEYKLGFSIKNVYDFMPGEKINSQADLINFICQMEESNNKWRYKREELKEYCHKYLDNKNTERFWREIIGNN